MCSITSSIFYSQTRIEQDHKKSKRDCILLTVIAHAAKKKKKKNLSEENVTEFFLEQLMNFKKKVY